MNYSVVLMAGALFALVLDNKSPIASVVVFVLGAYLLAFSTLLLKNREE